MDAEQQLPDSILNLATLRGREYAWAPENVPSVFAAAKDLDLAVLGGQLQFRVPDGTCELYWVNFEADSKQETESWEEFVQRAAQRCQQQFLGAMEKYDLLHEGLESFKILQESHENGIDIMKYAYFVVYVVNETEYKRLQVA